MVTWEAGMKSIVMNWWCHKLMMSWIDDVILNKSPILQPCQSSSEFLTEAGLKSIVMNWWCHELMMSWIDDVMNWWCHEYQSPILQPCLSSSSSALLFLASFFMNSSFCLIVETSFWNLWNNRLFFDKIQNRSDFNFRYFSIYSYFKKKHRLGLIYITYI